jgi:hypothetical protein
LAQITEQIEALNSKLAELVGETEAAPVQPVAPVLEPVKEKRKYRLSAAGKAKKKAALKARKSKWEAGLKAGWTGVKAGKTNAKSFEKLVAKPVKMRRKMSAEGRARIALAAKARWARVRAGKAK